MDIVYVIGKGSKHNNIELRMSLRSIAKYGDGIGRVIVVGSPPDWLSDEVVKMPVTDPYRRKHHNILNCIEYVVDHANLSGDFLYSSDDHFYVRETDFAHYPYYYKSLALRSEVKPGDKFAQYHQSIVDTRKLLEKHSMPFANYSQHCNTHMNGDVVRRYRWLIQESYLTKYGAEPTSLILNVLNYLGKMPRHVKRADLKVRQAASMQELLKQIGDRECFSVSDSIFNGPVINDFFKRKFPDPCRFEKI